MMVSFTNFTICETEVQNERKHTTTLAFTSLPLHDQSDRSQQNRGAAHSTLQCATQQLPSLGTFHHLPHLCIPADELDTAGAEVNIWMA